MKSARELKKLANELRGEVLKMVAEAGAGHIAGPLSAADLLTIFYLGDGLRHAPETPWSPERDRFVLSCGHYAPILYAALAYAGYFPKKELLTFGQLGSELGIHPERRMGDASLPGVEVSGGPLGQGVSVAVGMALAIKAKYGYRSQATTPRVYCLLSDGELQEGQVWEAFQVAVRRQLDNLIFVLDRNRVQIERYVSEVTDNREVAGKLEAFGLYVLETDGNEIEELTDTLEKAKKVHGAPAAIVMKTVAGKGVSFMENKPIWHDRVPTEEELDKALKELDAD